MTDLNNDIRIITRGIIDMEEGIGETETELVVTGIMTDIIQGMIDMIDMTGMIADETVAINDIDIEGWLILLSGFKTKSCDSPALLYDPNSR